MSDNIPNITLKLDLIRLFEPFVNGNRSTCLQFHNRRVLYLYLDLSLKFCNDQVTKTALVYIMTFYC